MTNSSDQERKIAILEALNAALKEAYDANVFSVRAFGDAWGWVRGGTPVYDKNPGQFLIAEVDPPDAPRFRFIIQREDVLDVGTHEIALAFIQHQDFSDFERTDEKVFYHQFVPGWGSGPGQLKVWEVGALDAE